MISPYTPDQLPAACCAFTGPFEGSVLWPYIDTSGNVTIFVGHLLASELALREIFPSTATEEIDAAWDSLRAAKWGMAADFYETVTNLRGTPEQSAALFLEDMTTRTAQLSKRVPDLYNFDGAIQQAIGDIYFNTGAIFRKMMAALRSGDYVLAAKESHRIGIQDARNRATYNLIMSAAPEGTIS